MTWLFFALLLQGAFSGPAQVIDGDTLIVREQRIRLAGIDAPELAQRCGQRRQQACGKAAAAWLKALWKTSG